MYEFLLSLPRWAGFLVAISLTVIFGFIVYYIAFKFITTKKSYELLGSTNSLFTVTGVLVALMLSLSFADVVVDLRGIENAIERESVAISDVFFDLQQFDAEGTKSTQTLLIDYTKAVIDDDWPALANDQLGKDAGKLLKQISNNVLQLEALTSIQKKLLPRILDDVDLISDFRLIRQENSLSKPPIFINVIIIGFLISMACFGNNKPNKTLLTLVALYSSFIGLVLFLILALSDPFQGGFGVDTTSYENVLQIMQSNKI